MIKSIIVAIADNYAIGKDNALLWHISEDLKFFKKTTLGCPVIMGRKTFESIGRPLPKRLNIIVSRSGYDAPDGVVVVPSLEEAFSTAEGYFAGLDSTISDRRCFVIGGGQIYAQSMRLVDELVVTHVHKTIQDADTFFPEIKPDEWRISERSEQYSDLESGWKYEFVKYNRV